MYWFQTSPLLFLWSNLKIAGISWIIPRIWGCSFFSVGSRIFSNASACVILKTVQVLFILNSVSPFKYRQFDLSTSLLSKWYSPELVLASSYSCSLNLLFSGCLVTAQQFEFLMLKGKHSLAMSGEEGGPVDSEHNKVKSSW